MRVSSLCATAALCAALLSVGCNNTVELPADSRPQAKADTKKNDTPAEAKTDPITSAKAAEPWGTVTGRVTWAEKDLPAPDKLVVNKDVAHCLKNGPIHREKFVVNKDNKGVANVFVWLLDATDPDHPKAPPIHPSLKEPREKEVVVDQPCCKFEPHVVALRQGQVLIAKNSSEVLHNFKWEGGNDQGDNPSIPAGGQVVIKDLKASPKVFAVQCGVHPWMSAWFRVFDHPYFAVTDGDGKYEMKKAPAGKYNVVMWQEGMGWVNGGKLGKPVEIKAGGTTEADGQVVPDKE